MSPIDTKATLTPHLQNTLQQILAKGVLSSADILYLMMLVIVTMKRFNHINISFEYPWWKQYCIDDHERH